MAYSLEGRVEPCLGRGSGIRGLVPFRPVPKVRPRLRARGRRLDRCGRSGNGFCGLGRNRLGPERIGRDRTWRRRIFRH